MCKNTKVKTYLGQKGYSIYKNSISVNEQHFIREQLNVAPYTPKSPIKPIPFPVYLESSQKLYVPRYFGIEHFGVPDELRIGNGKNTNLKFTGEMRDYQIEIIDKYIEHINNLSNSKADNKVDDKKEYGIGGGGLIELQCGRGKTVIALNIISRLKKKTLVIVHKGFLLMQWIERIKQFLPDAKIGQIQGQIIDIEDKDIVIGMLQSLSMKDYPDSIFQEFGLTIIDECHHISSEVFSRSLQKIVTLYTLGLSATMQRKDGLTRVFKMFLGEIVHKDKKESTDKVLVKTIKYHINDDDFNEVEYDFRGNVKYSTMISKLCNYNRRSEFIIKVLENELKINNNQQIMILAHNKCLLTYLYKAIEYRKFATVGYYIGGMKDADLKASEHKQIIIATYSMAAEALDIKTLTTLLMATPKTDIIQAVGRILRVKHEQPLIIDIIDSHDIFERQYNKRKAFYIQNNYKIIYTNSNLYGSNESNNSSEWTTKFDPDNITTKKTSRSAKPKKTDKSIDKFNKVDTCNENKILYIDTKSYLEKELPNKCLISI